MNFFTTNAAAYLENHFNIINKLHITPGIRFEYLNNILSGYDKNKAEDSNEDKVFANHNQHTRQFVLFGTSLQYDFNENINFYANFQQSYRPVTYSDLTPFGTIAKIDPKLSDPSADNADIGFRGSYKNIINFDISGFYIHYKNKIGTIIKTDTVSYYFRTNTGSAEHKGIESYLELNILNGLINTSQYGRLSIYNSLAYIQANYISGKYAGNKVEYAPNIIERIGLSYNTKKFSLNIQYSYTAEQFADAANTKFDVNGIEGIIPSYEVIDLSSSIKINSNCKFNFGINNLLDKKYFTLRTDEYPGPGIIPAIGRMIYGGLNVNF